MKLLLKEMNDILDGTQTTEREERDGKKIARNVTNKPPSGSVQKIVL